MIIVKSAGVLWLLPRIQGLFEYYYFYITSCSVCFIVIKRKASFQCHTSCLNFCSNPSSAFSLPFIWPFTPRSVVTESTQHTIPVPLGHPPGKSIIGSDLLPYSALLSSLFLFLCIFPDIQMRSVYDTWLRYLRCRRTSFGGVSILPHKLKWKSLTVYVLKESCINDHIAIKIVEGWISCIWQLWA